MLEEVNTYQEKQTITPGKVHIFLVDGTGTNKDGRIIKGYANYDGFVAFVFADAHTDLKDIAHTIAQEIGHAVFILEHPNEITGGIESQALMDYGGGEELWLAEWDVIHQGNLTGFWGSGKQYLGNEEETSATEDVMFEESKIVTEDFAGGFVVVGGKEFRMDFWWHAFQPLAKKSQYGRELIETALIRAKESKIILVICDNADLPVQVGNKLGNAYLLPFNIKKASESYSAYNGTGINGIPSPPETSLAHELLHFIHYCESKEYGEFIITNNPVMDYGSSYSNRTASEDEINAVKAENIVRMQLGLPLRTHYSGEYIFNVKLSSSWKSFYSKRYKTNGNGYYLIEKGSKEKQKLLDELNTYKSSNIILSHEQYMDWYGKNFKVIRKAAQRWGYTNSIVNVKGSDPVSICLFKK